MQQQETDIVLVTTYTLHEKNSTYIFLACTNNIRMSDTPLPNHNAHKIKTKKNKKEKNKKEKEKQNKHENLNSQKHTTGTTMTHKRKQPQAFVTI